MNATGRSTDRVKGVDFGLGCWASFVLFSFKILGLTQSFFFFSEPKPYSNRIGLKNEPNPSLKFNQAQPKPYNSGLIFEFTSWVYTPISMRSPQFNYFLMVIGYRFETHSLIIILGYDKMSTTQR